MAKWDRIGIKHQMTAEELDKRIKSLEKNVKVLNRLHFIRNRYLGDSVELAASKSGVTKRVGYIWQERWNEEGYDWCLSMVVGDPHNSLTKKKSN